MKNKINPLILAVLVAVVSGCASAPKPLAYLALDPPEGVISSQPGNVMEKQFSRGGFYFLNYGFRPAPEINLYISETVKEAKTNVLRNADIRCNVPFALDILMFGYNGSTDAVTVARNP
jgi:hypothetical protein